MNSAIRVLLVEDHPEYREVIDLALRREAGMELVGQFGTAEASLRFLEGGECAVSPDVILLDLNLPGKSGIDSISWYRQAVPKARILILTQSDHEADILRAIGEGASGYLLKSQPLGEITESIRTVSDGGAIMEARVAAFILRTLRSKLPEGEMEQQLTGREIEVLGLLAEGLAKKEIAARLGIGITTVVTHVVNLYRKLDARNAPAAIARAFQLGVLPRNRDDGGR